VIDAAPEGLTVATPIPLPGWRGIRPPSDQWASNAANHEEPPGRGARLGTPYTSWYVGMSAGTGGEFVSSGYSLM